jgi:hypothetical protein
VRVIFSRVFLLVAVLAMTGCQSFSTGDWGASLDDLGKCVSEKRRFSDGVVRMYLKRPAATPDPLLKADAYDLLLSDAVLNDAIGNSLERCILMSAGVGKSFFEQGTRSAADGNAADFLPKDLQLELRRAVDEVAAKQETTVGTRSSIAEDLLKRISEVAILKLNEELRATYVLELKTTAFVFGGNPPESSRTASVTLHQSRFDAVSTAIPSNVLLWRGSGIDGFEFNVKVTRTSPIYNQIKALLDKQRQSKYFESNLGKLFAAAATVVHPLLIGPATSIGQSLGERVDSSIQDSLVSFTDLRPTLFQGSQTALTAVPGSKVDIDQMLARSGREVLVTAVLADKANRPDNELESSDFETLLKGKWSVRMWRSSTGAGAVK